MRLFVGLDLPETVAGSLNYLLDQLRPTAPLRWSPVRNLHITTKFIGEFPEERLPELNKVLATVHSPSIEIAIRGLGWFPNPHSPRVLFAAVRAPQALADLAAATDAATAALGVEKEKRAYSPHLTLARIEDHANLSALRQSIAALPSDEFGQFTATAFHLYLSKMQPGGSVYSKLSSFALNQA